jgi:hypothetical protein
MPLTSGCYGFDGYIPTKNFSHLPRPAARIVRFCRKTRFEYFDAAPNIMNGELADAKRGLDIFIVNFKLAWLRMLRWELVLGFTNRYPVNYVLNRRATNSRCNVFTRGRVDSQFSVLSLAEKSAAVILPAAILLRLVLPLSREEIFPTKNSGSPSWSRPLSDLIACSRVRLFNKETSNDDREFCSKTKC